MENINLSEHITRVVVSGCNSVFGCQVFRQIKNRNKNHESSKLATSNNQNRWESAIASSEKVILHIQNCKASFGCLHWEAWHCIGLNVNILGY
jgi:hypothetical protein